MIGEPDAGNLHVRFDEGTQETCEHATRLCPTLPAWWAAFLIHPNWFVAALWAKNPHAVLCALLADLW